MSRPCSLHGAPHGPREVAIRMALGASRWRIVRQHLMEAITLATLADVLGVILTKWTITVARPLTDTCQRQMPKNRSGAFGSSARATGMSCRSPSKRAGGWTLGTTRESEDVHAASWSARPLSIGIGLARTRSGSASVLTSPAWA